MARLTRSSLSRLPSSSRPAIVPGAAGVGIVHLGVGAFHRAHQAVYTEAAMAKAGGDWAIAAVAPRSRDVIDALAAQDGLYSVTTLSNGDSSTRVVAAFADVGHVASDPESVVRRLADPAVRVVTLTVTEKAYLLDPATGRLREDEQLRAELAGDRPPQSVPGVLIAALRVREAAGSGPLAVVSCDNLPSNGYRLGAAVAMGYERADFDKEWLTANVTFPATMVDRIVPAPTKSTRDHAEAALGLRDEAAVAAEPFSQWVVEDRFPGGRPAWDAVGAVLTESVEPYERLKLRVLNGVHSALAYLGVLAGCETIDDALRLPGMAAFMERFIADDIAPTLSPPSGVSVSAYGAQVLERFSNAAVGHRTLQVAMDGSQKLPQRWLHTVGERRSQGATPQWAALAVAAWMRFVAGRADDGRVLPLDDPLAAVLHSALDQRRSDPVTALLGVGEVFPSGLAADEEFRHEVTRWWRDLEAHGAAATVAGATQ